MDNKVSKINKSNVLQLSICAITLILNSVAYFFLPGQVGIQVNGGGVSNSAPKLIYLTVSFLVIALLCYFGSKPVGYRKNQYTGIAIFLSIMNVLTIILNLIFLT